MANEERTIADRVESMGEVATEGFQAIEDGVVGTYKRIEDAFVGTFLRHGGETIEEAKERLRASHESEE